jgi:DNA polymerase III delta prime subunit
MHAFLIVGNNGEELRAKVEELAKKLKVKILEFPLAKIEDVRNLNSLIRLSFDEPTMIVSENIDEASEEALNAFLKNLEEPQDNIYFALTAPSTRKVLATIVSRCQVIKSTNKQIYKSANEDIEKFMKAEVGERLALIDKIKDREMALEFVESLIDYYHSTIHSDARQEVGPLDTLAQNAETATTTLINLKANGNVSLQLTNMVVSLV